MKRLSQSIFLISVIFLLLVGMAMTGCGTALTQAAKEGDIKTLKALMENPNDPINADDKCWALHYGVWGNQIEAVKFLIENGTDVNCKDGDALGTAIYHKRNNIAKLLLDKGVNVNGGSSIYNFAGGNHLSFAAVHLNAEIIRLLIEGGADTDGAIAALERIGGKQSGIALIKKYARKQEPLTEMINVKSQEELPHFIKSDIDELPNIKAKHNKNAYAIVIGIESYRQKLPKADFAVADAKTMTEYLTKVMGYPEENVVTLTNDRASLTDFIKYFEKWLPNNVEKDSSVFIYYSGHGAPNTKTGDAYLVPYDGDPSFIEQTGYSLKRLYENLGRLQAKEIIVALDSCFSGAGGRSVIAKGARPLVMNLEQDIKLSKNMIVMSASSGDQISSTYEEKGHGLFTYFMLKGIKDGITEIGELFDYLKPHVGRTARKVYNNEQSPQLIAPEKKKVFLMKRQ